MQHSENNNEYLQFWLETHGCGWCLLSVFLHPCFQDLVCGGSEMYPGWGATTPPHQRPPTSQSPALAPTTLCKNGHWPGRLHQLLCLCLLCTNYYSLKLGIMNTCVFWSQSANLEWPQCDLVTRRGVKYTKHQTISVRDNSFIDDSSKIISILCLVKRLMSHDMILNIIEHPLKISAFSSPPLTSLLHLRVDHKKSSKFFTPAWLGLAWPESDSNHFLSIFKVGRKETGGDTLGQHTGHTLDWVQLDNNCLILCRDSAQISFKVSCSNSNIEITHLSCTLSV